MQPPSLLILRLAVFLCGMAVMMLEMVGSRVLEPYCGSSVVVWTALIGAMLGFMSLGYWRGGVIADARPVARGLSLVIFLGGAGTALVAVAGPWVLSWIEEAIRERLWAVTLSGLLFAPASYVLGMVSPYAVRLATSDPARAGSVTGGLYALSTLGGIVGVFAAGFYLIALVGANNLVFLLAAGLVLISLLVSRSDLALKLVLLGVVAWLGFASAAEQIELAGLGEIDVDTAYSRVLITTARHRESGRPTRLMRTSPKFIQSAMFLDDPAELVLNYTKYYTLALGLVPEARRVLVLGGAGYSFPKHVLANCPGVSVDVVELDPGMTGLAREHFALRDDPRLRIFHEDARTFLNREKGPYDIVLVDAFGSIYSVPFHLTTRQAAGRIHALLNPGGVVMLNMVSALSGDKGGFFQAEAATYARFFSDLAVFAVSDPKDVTRAQNLVLAGIKGGRIDRSLIGEPFAAHLAEVALQGAAALDDDFAPVDLFMARVEMAD